MRVTYSLTIFFSIFVPLSFATFAEFTKFIIDVQQKFQTPSVSIAINNANDWTRESNMASTLINYLSKKNIYINFLSLKELEREVAYYDGKIFRHLIAIDISSWKSFELFRSLTRRINISRFVSLVIFRTKNQTMIEACKNPKENYFNLTFNVEMLVVCNTRYTPVQEWYSIFPDKTETMNYATWGFEKGLTLLGDPNLYMRRGSLKGIKLRVTTVKSESTPRNMELDGFYGKIVNIMSKSINFTIDRQEPEEYYGALNSTDNSYNGIIRRLIDNETDIGLAEFMITSNRYEIVDFTIPIIVAMMHYYVKEPTALTLQWSMYYSSIGFKSVLIVTFVILMSPFVIGSITHAHIRMQSKSKRSKISFIKVVPSCYFTVWRILCLKTNGFPRIFSLRVTHFTLLMLAYVLTSVYSATLTSHLALWEPDLPFNSIEEFMKDGSYRISVVRNTYFYESFHLKSNDSSLHKLNNYLLRYDDLPKNFDVAINEICNDKKQVLFLDDYRYNKFRNSYPCKIIPFSSSFSSSMSFAFTKNSPYVDIFNYYIRKMRNAGILRLLLSRYNLQNESHEDKYQQVNFWSVQPVFAIVGVGIALAIIILIVEIIVYPFYNQWYKFKKSRTNYWRPMIRPK